MGALQVAGKTAAARRPAVKVDPQPEMTIDRSHMSVMNIDGQMLLVDLSRWDVQPGEDAIVLECSGKKPSIARITHSNLLGPRDRYACIALGSSARLQVFVLGRIVDRA